MLTAVWTVLGVLKIVGLILLGLTGFLIVLLLLVLLAPIRYQAEMNFDKALKGKAGVSWLCHMLSARAVYDKKLMLLVRVLGFPVFRMEKVPGKTEARENEKAQEESEPPSKGPPDGQKTVIESAQEKGKTAEERMPGDPEPVKQKPRESSEDAMEGLADKPETTKEKQPEGSESAREKVFEDPEIFEEKSPGAPEESPKTRESPETDKKQAALGPKKRKKKKLKKNRGFSFRKIYDRLKEKLHRIIRRLMELKEKKNRWIAFVQDPVNQRTCRLLKRQLWKLVRHILPQRISGRVRFGFDDPAKTGQILAAISPFYAWYARRVEVIPVFEESVLEEQLRLRGRIRIGTVLGLAAVTLFDKNFRALLRKLLRA